MSASETSESNAPSAPATADSAPRTKGLFAELQRGLGWARKNPVRALGTLGLVLLVGLGLSFAAIPFLPTVEPAKPATLEDALKALDAGDFVQARRLALELRKRELSYSEIGGPLFVLGIAIANDADEHWNAGDRRLLHLVAAKYLQEARSHDFPAGREAEGNFRLGRSWFLSGNYDRSLGPLRAVLQEPDSPWQLSSRVLLAEAHLNLTPPDYETALQLNVACLRDKRLKGPARVEAELRECRIRLAQGDLARCRESLGKVDANASPAATALMRGRLLLAEGDALARDESKEQRKAKYTEAVQVLGEALAKEGGDKPSNVSIQYVFGLALDRLDETKQAETVFGRIRRQTALTPEKVAAGMQEVRLVAVRGDYAEAVQLLRGVLENAGLLDLPNMWISKDQVQQQCNQLHRDLLATEEFDVALSMSEFEAGFIGPWQLALWKAETFIARAAVTERDTAGLLPEKAETQLAKARADHRLAGQAFAQLAELRKAEREYTEDLWNSAQQFYLGRDFYHAAEATRTYLRNESRQRRPDALLLLAESELALNQVDSAIAAITECLEVFPRHPVSYRARIVAAQANAERGLLAEAKMYLSDNVDDEILSPRSAEWRDSLFLLGKLLHREGVEAEAKSRANGIDSELPDRVKASLPDLERAHVAFRRAVEELGKAVERYPDAPQVREARFLLADAYRQASKWPRKRSKIVTIEATRAALARQSQQDLLQAIATYDKIITQLGDVQESPTHTRLDKRILRNAYFAKADSLFDLGRLEDAIKAYSAATNRYQNEPEALEAYVQIAACYRLLNKPAEARGTLEQASLMLRRMKPDADFAHSTPYSRDEWMQLITWLATL